MRRQRRTFAQIVAKEAASAEHPGPYRALGGTIMDANGTTAAQCNPHTPAGKALATRIAELLNGESKCDVG
jgi:hypothetical protein